MNVKCIFLGVEQAQQTICGASLCRTNCVSLEWLPHSWGWIFGVCGGKRGWCQREQKIPCAAETFSLFLVPGAGNSLLLSELLSPAGGGTGGCSGPFSVLWCGAHKENRGKVCQEQREILAVIRLDLECQPVPGSVVISFPTCQGLV